MLIWVVVQTNIMNFKYIVVELGGLKVPLVFASWFPHDHAAGNGEVKSAGFCDLDAAVKWVASGS